MKSTTLTATEIADIAALCQSRGADSVLAAVSLWLDGLDSDAVQLGARHLESAIAALEGVEW